MAEEQALVQLMDTLDGLELTKSEYEWLEQRFAAMTEKEQLLFRSAMKLEKPETASGAISIASQLHCYELFYSAGDEDALGQFVMKHLEQVPDASRPYFSPAYVGQMFRQEGASGVFCEGHYIRRSAAPKHQPDKNLSELPTTGEYAIRIKLASRSNMEGVWIGFPDAGEYTDPNYPDELLLGLDAMQVERLSECIALEVDCCLPQLMDILSQYDSASELVRHAIDAFFRRNVLQYDYEGKTVCFVGSNACAYSGVLTEVADSYNIKIKKIAPSSMPGLVKYHSTDR